ncbi:ArdC family protein [Megamonas hypermegale]|jgi:antirestriction protein ArdC|uniref:ArdC family protein n=2 Tax=Megamonas hypermegale TaxID=158847 RepID=UPI0026F25059|nr:zincin-like metallopeptidase domain-containing protein [Megamonas hypermegale]
MKMALPEKIQQQRNEMVKQIVEDIKAGKPFFWDSGHFGKYPRNLLKALQGKDQFYNGINNLKLTFTANRFGFKDSRWATFKQAQEAGAKIKKGAKGVHIEFWQYAKPIMEVNPKTGKKEQVYVIDEETGKKVPAYAELEHPIVKSYVVFNAEQMEGIEPEKIIKLSHEKTNEAMENMIKNSEAPVIFDQISTNYYEPSSDTIHVIPKEHFKSVDAFYATVSHEIAHSTGSEKRLNRVTLTTPSSFGSEIYAKEELRAELTSMFLAQKYSINFDKSHYENHTAYLQSWAKVLENNPNEIFKAASEAEKAMRYIEERMINIRTNELEVDDKKIDNIENFSSKAVKLNASQMYLATAQKLLKASNNTWQKDFNQTIIEELSKSGKNIFDIKNAVMKHSPVKVTNSELTELAKTLKKSTTLIR